MKKVTVTRKEPLGDNPYFTVSVEGVGIVRCFTFERDAPKEKHYSEERCRQEAMALAASIENGSEAKEEIIYQTPTE